MFDARKAPRQYVDDKLSGLLNEVF